MSCLTYFDCFGFGSDPIRVHIRVSSDLVYVHSARIEFVSLFFQFISSIDRHSSHVNARPGRVDWAWVALVRVLGRIWVEFVRVQIKTGLLDFMCRVGSFRSGHFGSGQFD